LRPNGAASDRPAESHADLNLARRGTMAIPGRQVLVDYGGDSDLRAPQLWRLFADNRTAAFRTLYRVFDWNWSCDCRGAAITDPEVTLVGMLTTAGEPIRVPDSGYEIGSGIEVLVLYAAPSRLTLKYTREDNVVYGYTIHLEGLCVDPALLALYKDFDRSGRRQLPALRAGQAVGRAAGTELGVAIRDVGRFMDPRSRKDWWRGR
jgi:hypothetical protein